MKRRKQMKKKLVTGLATMLFMFGMVGMASAEYIQVFEKDANADLAFFTYDTLADVATGWSARTDRLESTNVWSNDWSMVGLAHDGTQYIQAFEMDANANLAFFTYDTLADVATGWSARTGRLESTNVWSNDWSMVGLAHHPVPEPSTMILFGTGLIGLVGWGRRKFKK